MADELLDKLSKLLSSQEIERTEETRARELRELCEASGRWKELERKRLTDLCFPSLGTVKSNIEAGDRKAMLELLTTTADSLRAFDALPQETRESLADCLQAMRNNLEAAKETKKAKGFPNRRSVGR